MDGLPAIQIGLCTLSALSRMIVAVKVLLEQLGQQIASFGLSAAELFSFLEVLLVQVLIDGLIKLVLTAQKQDELLLQVFLLPIMDNFFSQDRGSIDNSQQAQSD